MAQANVTAKSPRPIVWCSLAFLCSWKVAENEGHIRASKEMRAEDNSLKERTLLLINISKSTSSLDQFIPPKI